MTEDGLIIRVRRGEYEFIPSIKNYIESINNVFEEFEDENVETCQFKRTLCQKKY